MLVRGRCTPSCAARTSPARRHRQPWTTSRSGSAQENSVAELFASAGETPLTAGLFSVFAHAAHAVMSDGVPGRTAARSRPSSWGSSPGTRSLTDQAAAPVQGGDGDGLAGVAVPLGAEADRFEGGHDLVADGRGGVGRAVEAAVEEHQALAGRGGVRALGVEVDETTGARPAFFTDLGLAAVTATGEVLARGDTGLPQGGERAGEPLGIGLALPLGLLPDPLQPQPVRQRLRLPARHGPTVLGDQILLSELGQFGAGGIAADQHLADALLQLRALVLAQVERRHLAGRAHVQQRPRHTAVPPRLLARPAGHRGDHDLGTAGRRLEVPVSGTVAVLQRVVTTGLVPDLGEDIGQVGYPLDHQEPVTVTTDAPDQSGQLPFGHTDVPLPVLRLHHDLEHAQTLTHPSDRALRSRGEAAAGTARRPARAPRRSGRRNWPAGISDGAGAPS